MSEKPSELPLISKIFLQRWKKFLPDQGGISKCKTKKLTNMNSVN